MPSPDIQPAPQTQDMWEHGVERGGALSKALQNWRTANEMIGGVGWKPTSKNLFDQYNLERFPAGSSPIKLLLGGLQMPKIWNIFHLYEWLTYGSTLF